MLATIVDTKALLQVVWISAASGIGLTIVFSVTIAGAARATHERREGRAGPAIAWATVATLCAMVCVAAVIIAVTIMLKK
jgi:hypothetical protein